VVATAIDRLDDRYPWRRNELGREYPTVIFFPARRSALAAAPKRVCAACPVRCECDEYRVERRVLLERGGRIWGGRAVRG
jgi:hypothetical protein